MISTVFTKFVVPIGMALFADYVSVKKESTKRLCVFSKLKERVVDVLNLREPEGLRAKRIVYRYAIYTPQEEMKNVLIGKVEH